MNSWRGALTRIKRGFAFGLVTTIVVLGGVLALASFFGKRSNCDVGPGHDQLVVTFKAFTTLTEKARVFTLLGNEQPRCSGDICVFESFDPQSVSIVRSLPYVLTIGPWTCPD